MRILSNKDKKKREALADITDVSYEYVVNSIYTFYRKLGDLGAAISAAADEASIPVSEVQRIANELELDSEFAPNARGVIVSDSRKRRRRRGRVVTEGSLFQDAVDVMTNKFRKMDIGEVLSAMIMAWSQSKASSMDLEDCKRDLVKKLSMLELRTVDMYRELDMYEKKKDGLKEARVNYDWHLPSKEVLNAMYEYRKSIGGFKPNYYWSSSENDNDNAWLQGFFNDLQNSSYKGNYARVRAVRALPEGHSETEHVFTADGVDYRAYPKDAPKEMDWNEAIRWCENLN